MKHFIKTIALLAVLLFGLTACQSESYIWYPDNECLTFSANTGNYLLHEEPVIGFKLVRGVIDVPLTVNLSFTGDPIFSLSTPATISFAPGEYEADVAVTYDMSLVEAGEIYTFVVSFDKSMVSPSGWYQFAGQAVMPGGDDSEFEDYATVEFYQSRLNAFVTLYDELNSTLMVSKYNKSKYRIRNVMNSDINLDFTLTKEGELTLVAPEPTLCPYDGGSYIRIPSTIEYEGEPVTFWIDPDPGYLYVDNLASGDYPMGMTEDGGTSIYWYVWMETASKGILKFIDGDDGWWKQYYDVVNFNPVPNNEIDYTKYAQVEFYQSRLNAYVNSEKVLHSNLWINNYDNTKYRIKHVMGSDLDLDFTLTADGVLTLLAPEPTLCPHDNNKYIRIPSAIEYEGEKVVFWIDTAPRYLYADNVASGNPMGMTDDGGTSIYWYVWMETESKGILKFSDGDDGWWKQYYDVVKLY
jgi:hypothetical protein